MTRSLALSLSVLTLVAAGNVGVCRANSESFKDYSLDDAAKLVRANQGSVVIFHLYASWCTPCRAEIPALVRVCDRYKGQPFQMVAFSMDQNPSDLKKFFTQFPVNFEQRRLVPSARSQLDQTFRGLGMNYSNSIPFTAVFDPSGKMIKQWSGAKSHGAYVSILDDLFLTTVATSAKDPRRTPKPEPESPANEATREEPKTPPATEADTTIAAPTSSPWRMLAWLALAVTGMLGSALAALAVFLYLRREGIAPAPPAAEVSLPDAFP